jgi:hypothetical protein
VDVPTNHVSNVLKLRAGKHSGFGRVGEAMLRYENEIQILGRKSKKYNYIQDESKIKIILAVGFIICEKLSPPLKYMKL